MFIYGRWTEVISNYMRKVYVPFIHSSIQPSNPSVSQPSVSSVIHLSSIHPSVSAPHLFFLTSIIHPSIHHHDRMLESEIIGTRDLKCCEMKENYPQSPTVTPAAWPPPLPLCPPPSHSSVIHESLCAPLLSRCVNSLLGCVYSAARCIFHVFSFVGFLVAFSPTVAAE